MKDIQDLIEQYKRRIPYSSGKGNYKIFNNVHDKEAIDDYLENANKTYEQIKEIEPRYLEWEHIEKLEAAIIDYEDCITKVISLYTGPFSSIRRSMSDLEFTYEEFKVLIDNHQDLQDKVKDLTLIKHCQD